MKQDQMSMAASIESRVPFLDHKLVEFAAALPDEWKLRGFTTKRILREAMQGAAAARRSSTRPKMGFPVPFALLDARPLERRRARRAARLARARERGIIDPAAVDALLDDHAAGTTDGGDALWSLLNLELWYRTFIDGEGVQTLPGADGRVRRPPPARVAEGRPHEAFSG